MRLFIPAFTALISFSCVALAEDQPKAIGPAEAAKKVNEQVVLQMEVKSSGLRNEVCYLNSEKDFKDPKNFTLFISKDVLQKFKQANIDNPAIHFQDKTVRVKGKVTVFRDKAQIVIEKPEQIVLVSEASKQDNAK